MHLNYFNPIESKIYHFIKGFRDKNGKSTSKNVCRLGNLHEIREKGRCHGCVIMGKVST